MSDQKHHTFHVAGVFSLALHIVPKVTHEELGRLGGLMNKIRYCSSTNSWLPEHIYPSGPGPENRQFVGLSRTRQMMDDINQHGFFMSCCRNLETLEGWGSCMVAVPNTLSEGPVFVIGHPNYEAITVLQPYDVKNPAELWDEATALAELLKYIRELRVHPLIHAFNTTIDVPQQYDEYLDRLWSTRSNSWRLGDHLDSRLSFEYMIGETRGMAGVSMHPMGGYTITVSGNYEDSAAHLREATEAALDAFITLIRNRTISLGSLPNF